MAKIKAGGMTCALVYGVSLLLINMPLARAADQETIAQAASGLTMRSIGPALMGGRIADIAVHPDKSSTWYIAAGSGGVWKTVTAGITWTPVFDSEAS